MPDLDDFRAFYALADRLIDSASKEDVAEAARLLALNVAHYQQKYGALPFEDFAGMLRADDIDAETAKKLGKRPFLPPHCRTYRNPSTRPIFECPSKTRNIN
jgi:hypothetical protein